MKGEWTMMACIMLTQMGNYGTTVNLIKMLCGMVKRGNGQSSMGIKQLLPLFPVPPRRNSLGRPQGQDGKAPQHPPPLPPSNGHKDGHKDKENTPSAGAVGGRPDERRRPETKGKPVKDEDEEEEGASKRKHTSVADLRVTFPPSKPPESPVESPEESEDEDEDDGPVRHPDSLLTRLLDDWGEDIEDLKRKICNDLDRTKQVLGIPQKKRP
ncbi:E4 protein [Felis catus papillomavirus 6]|uniref:E4 protein n=1 Tax=Felis catus papillomavirus 6 TaxID=2704502 RepID=A0A6B9WD93_9PAPI|nr:E4 protein [Felis catus papillomavirus 6]